MHTYTSYTGIAVHDKGPGGCITVSPLLAALHVAGGRDFMNGHYDYVATTEAGHKHIYMSSLFHHGLVDRALTDWLGPSIFIMRRKAKTVAPIYVGDLVTWTVTAIAKDEKKKTATFQVVLRTEGGVCCVAETTVCWPARAQSVHWQTAPD